MPPVPASCPEPPEYLVGGALKTWRRIAPQLYALRVLTDLDVDALACLCQAIEDHRLAAVTLCREERYAQAQSGALQPHPAEAVQHRAAARIRAFAAEFGLTPSARVRIHVPSDKPTADDPLMWLMNPKGRKNHA